MLLNEFEIQKRNLRKYLSSKEYEEAVIENAICSFYDTDNYQFLKIKLNLKDEIFYDYLPQSQQKQLALIIRLLNNNLLKNGGTINEDNCNKYNKLTKEIGNLVRENYITKQKMNNKLYKNPEEEYHNKKFVKVIINRLKSTTTTELIQMEKVLRKKLSITLISRYNYENVYKETAEIFYENFYGHTAKELNSIYKVRSVNQEVDNDAKKYKIAFLILAEKLAYQKSSEKDFAKSIENMSIAEKEMFMDENCITPFEKEKEHIRINKIAKSATKSYTRKRLKKESDEL